MTAQDKEKNIQVSVISTDPPKGDAGSKKKPFFHINKEMLPFKLHYFLSVGAMGLSLPYLPIFAKTRIGLSATSLGALMTSQQFLFIFTKPLIGYIADYFNKLKAIILTCMVLYGASTLLFLPIPSIENGTHSFTEINLNDNRCQLIEMQIDTFHRHSKTQQPCNFDEIIEIDNTSNLNTRIIENHSEIFSSSCYQNTLDAHLNPYKTSNINMTENATLWLSKNFNSLLSINSTDQTVYCCRNASKMLLIFCDYSRDRAFSERNDFYTHQFWLYAAVHIVMGVCVNSLFTLSDTALCEAIQKTGDDFGKQRLFGAFSWGIMTVTGGLMYDYTKDYTSAFATLGILTILSVYNISKLDLGKPKFSKSILKEMTSVLKSKNFLVFEVGVFFCGLGTSITWFYEFIFLTSIGASRFLCGLALAIQSYLGIIPFMFFSGRLIKRFGHYNIVSIALLCYCTRFIWYSYLHNPWLVLPIETLHGVSHGLLCATLASFAKMNAKPGTEATTQGIVFTTYEGLGAGTGCILYGMVYDYFGGHQTMFYAGIISGCGMLIMAFLTLLLRKSIRSDNVNKS